MFVGSWIASAAASTAAYCACNACTCVSREVLKTSARLGYCFLFLMAMTTAWLMRDFAKPLIEKIPWIVRHGYEPSDKWYGQQAVYRVSMGNFLFFGFMAAALINVKTKGDKRDKFLHHGNWLLKLGLWLLFNALPFFLPNNIVNAYSWAARVGSGIFLIVQMLILLDFSLAWNDSWVAAAEDDQRWLYALLAATVTAFGGAITISGFLFYWFKPAGAGDCGFNVGMVVLALLIGVAITALSLSPYTKNGSLFPSAAISLYCMYLCYSALQSEPHDYQCNGLAKRFTAASGTTMAAGMLVTIISVIYSALRAGSNKNVFMLGDDEDEPNAQPLLEEGKMTSAGLDGVDPERNLSDGKDKKERAIDEFAPVTYSYSFFHLIFALASMYLAMLMTGWGTGTGEEKAQIDVGWASVWVKLSAQWLTAALYAWTLVAPTLLSDREF